MVGAMRIATWNVNSVRQRMPRLLPWLDDRRPDVVCLQETKLADDAFAELLDDELAARGYAVAAHGQGGWNGVAILSRVGLDDVVAGLAGLDPETCDPALVRGAWQRLDAEGTILLAGEQRLAIGARAKEPGAAKCRRPALGDARG